MGGITKEEIMGFELAAGMEILVRTPGFLNQLPATWVVLGNSE